MEYVFSTPDFSSPAGAVATFDAAVDGGDVNAVFECIAFASELRKREFDERLRTYGLNWFRRVKPHSWRYLDRKTTSCIVLRSALMEDGSFCEETFWTKKVPVGTKHNAWRLTGGPSIEIWIDHPRIGPITRESYWWTTHRFVPALGHVAELTIESDHRPPTEAQCEIFETVVRHAKLERDQICAKLFKLYTKQIVGSFSATDDDGNEVGHLLAPPIADPADIWPMLWPPFYIRIPERRRRSKYHAFTLDCNCQWDREHGLGIRFRDWRATGFCGSGE
jgi:Domain of unknown function (DUF6985)